MNFPFLDSDVPRLASYGVYISQLIRFARVCSHVADFNTRNKVLTAKLLRQGYRYQKRVGRKNPQKLTQLNSRSHPRHLVGKKDSTKRHHHRHHKRQPGEQQFSKQVVTG